MNFQPFLHFPKGNDLREKLRPVNLLFWPFSCLGGNKIWTFLLPFLPLFGPLVTLHDHYSRRQQSASEIGSWACGPAIHTEIFTVVPLPITATLQEISTSGSILSAFHTGYIPSSTPHAFQTIIYLHHQNSPFMYLSTILVLLNLSFFIFSIMVHFYAVPAHRRSDLLVSLNGHCYTGSCFKLLEQSTHTTWSTSFPHLSVIIYTPFFCITKDANNRSVGNVFWRWTPTAISVTNRAVPSTIVKFLLWLTRLLYASRAKTKQCRDLKPLTIAPNYRCDINYQWKVIAPNRELWHEHVPLLCGFRRREISFHAVCLFGWDASSTGSLNEKGGPKILHVLLWKIPLLPCKVQVASHRSSSIKERKVKYFNDVQVWYACFHICSIVYISLFQLSTSSLTAVVVEWRLKSLYCQT